MVTQPKEGDGNTVVLDVRGIVKLFGGSSALRWSLERRRLAVLAQGTVDKWVERNRITSDWLIKLMVLARMENIKFNPLAFVDRSKLTDSARRRFPRVTL
jgi:hypothetical protein